MIFAWHVYNVRGVDETSGKKSKLKIVARDEMSAENEAKKRGLLPPYSFTEIDFDEPTERQISYASSLGIQIMAGMNRKDISALIDKKNDEDTEPTEGLMNFAYDRNIYFSPYVGERALCNLLFNELSPTDKTAFFCYAVYCSLTGERLENLNVSPARNKIYEFAELYSEDVTYQRSLESYLGEELIRFGEADGGGSKRKKAYQDAAKFLNISRQGKSSFNKNDKLLADVEDNIKALKKISSDKPLLTPREITDEGFIEIGGQVAMPEETVAELLSVTIKKLHELSNSVDMWNREGGIYTRDGKLYFASPQVIFKVRDANGKKSADLSTQKLIQVFMQAEARLTPREYKKKNRRTMLIVGMVLLAIFIYAQVSAPPKTSTPAPPQSKVETPAEKPKPEVKRPENSMMLESKYAIERITKHYVTDSWILEYGEYVNPDGTISTHGACEIDSDGRKRLYWLTFDATGQKVLRLKIDSDLIYSADGK